MDGDCRRFLMCRKDKNNEGTIRGKIYKCPKGEMCNDTMKENDIIINVSTVPGYMFSSTGARCQPEDSVACHRSQSLASLMKQATARGDVLLLP